MSGEIYSYLFPKLLNNGAKDVYLNNIIMKKNRPAQKLNVLCSREKVEKLKKIIFKQTTTLGIREIEVKRSCLKRKYIEFISSLGKVKIKAAYYEGELLKFSPEYDDCAKLAEENGISILDVFEAVKKEASEKLFN